MGYPTYSFWVKLLTQRHHRLAPAHPLVHMLLLWLFFLDVLLGLLLPEQLHQLWKCGFEILQGRAEYISAVFSPIL